MSDLGAARKASGVPSGLRLLIEEGGWVGLGGREEHWVWVPGVGAFHGERWEEAWAGWWEEEMNDSQGGSGFGGRWGG